LSAIRETQPNQLDRATRIAKDQQKSTMKTSTITNTGKGKDDNDVADDVPGHALVDKARVGIQQRMEGKDDLQVDWQASSISRCFMAKDGVQKRPKSNWQA
jgi:hypothetical protein